MVAQNGTSRNYELRYWDSEKLMPSTEAIDRLGRSSLTVVDSEINKSIISYLGDTILIQIQRDSIATVTGRNEKDIEAKLKPITKKTGVRFH